MKPPGLQAPRRALVLCGGGARGAMEVGFYRAIRELGLSFELVVGSSVGALNGACIAGGMPPDDLARWWRALVAAMSSAGIGRHSGAWRAAELRPAAHAARDLAGAALRDLKLRWW